MNKVIVIFLVIALFSCEILHTKEPPVVTHDVQWAVIGAGPAGITTIGLLLDLGIDNQQIIWIDPEFNVGRLGKYYSTIPANTKTTLFIEFLQSCHAFNACSSKSIDQLYSCTQEKEYALDIIVKPLQDITNYLRTKVITKKAHLTALEYYYNQWHIYTNNEIITAKNVVLATGSKPKELNYECTVQIPLDEALDKERLSHYITNQDTVAVIGSAHSAILILKYLFELPTARIINFWKHPIVYPTTMGEWVLHEGKGLRGITAKWAKEVLEQHKAGKLVRVFNQTDSLSAWIPLCTKIIYAIGYERNLLPPIQGINYDSYNTTTGIIGPHLFGIGIAFPGKYEDPVGNKEAGVGLPDFMEYAQAVIPLWMQQKRSDMLSSFENLFSICLL